MTDVNVGALMVFRIKGLTCADCAAKLERDIAKLPGVTKSKLNFETAKLTIQGRVNPENVMEATRKHGVAATLEGAPKTKVFRLSGLTCADCALKLEKNIASLPGVELARLNFTAAKLNVVGNVAAYLIVEEARKEGVNATLEGAPSQQVSFFKKNIRVFISVISGLLLLSGWVAEVFWQLQNISTGLYLAAILVGGLATARKAVFSIIRNNISNLGFSFGQCPCLIKGHHS